VKIRARVVASVGATAAMLAFPLSTPAAAADSECHARALEPTFNNGTSPAIHASGAASCGSLPDQQVEFTVRLMRYRSWWFDEELAQKRGIGTFGQLTARYNCNGTGHSEVYTQVNIKSTEVQSRNVTIFFCG
jgi:hypothetical protein